MHDVRLVKIDNGWVVKAEDDDTETTLYFKDVQDAMAHIIGLYDEEEPEEKPKKK